METKTYKHLKLWTRPDYYMGATWPDYFVFLGKNRDSDVLTRSNFRTGMARLEKLEKTFSVEERSPKCVNCSGDNCEECSGDGTVPCIVNPYESHWACGHVEWIGIHKDSPVALLDAAEEMLASIGDYPCLDESDWSDLEYTEAMSFWDSMSLSMKVDYCRDADVSIFAARRSSDLPDRLYESLTRA